MNKKTFIFIFLVTTFFLIVAYFTSKNLWLVFLNSYLIIIGLVTSVLATFLLLIAYKKNWIYFNFLEDLQKVFKFGYIKFLLKLILISLIISSFFLVLAHPVKKYSTQDIEKNWIDIALVLDISKSMDSEDLKPTRLEAAKKIISEFIDKIKNDRVWLVIFAWAPITSLPLTFDYSIIKETLKNITTNTIDQNNPQLNWTAIWDALLMAKNLFKEDKDKKRQKVIILLTDWDANKWVDPILAAEYLKKFGIKIYTIWIWSKQWWYIKYKIWPFTQIARIPPLKTDTLEKIAKITWWVFFRATDNQTLEKIFKQLSKLTKTKIKIKKKVINENFFFPFSLLTSLLLIAFAYLRFKEI